MVYVPAGEFQMGSMDGYDDEQPAHTVSLDGFWIDKHEVTNAQFAVFLNEKGNQEEGGVTWLDLDSEYCLIEQSGGEFRPKPGYADHPVVVVSWYDAIAFCKWLSEETDKDFSLPSEAEWEKAARGIEGRIYPWGDKSPTANLCNFSRNVGDTTPVGKYSPKGDSPYGCADMAGNVWEWTRSLWGTDWKKPDFGYPYDPKDGRENLEGSGRRVLRGGSFYSTVNGVRCAYRLYWSPRGRGGSRGFRLVASPFTSGI